MAKAQLPDVIQKGPPSIPHEFLDRPLKILRTTSRRILGDHMNKEGVIIDNCHANDYTGIAEMIGFSNEDIKEFESTKNAMNSLLEAWGEESELMYKPILGNLWRLLEELQRYDVMEDCIQSILNDAENDQRQRENPPMVNDKNQGQTAADHYVDDTLILVKGDEPGSLKTFDAIVCTNLDAKLDAEFAHKLEENLEKESGITLCIPDRDDLPGAAKFNNYAAVIKNRCSFMIIVVSKAFKESSPCDFMLRFAHSLNPSTRGKRLIPIIIEQDAELPPMISHVTRCDFTKQDLQQLNWNRLRKTIIQGRNNVKWIDEETADVTAATTSPEKKSKSKLKRVFRVFFPKKGLTKDKPFVRKYDN